MSQTPATEAILSFDHSGHLLTLLRETDGSFWVHVEGKETLRARIYIAPDSEGALRYAVHKAGTREEFWSHRARRYVDKFSHMHRDRGALPLVFTPVGSNFERRRYDEGAAEAVRRRMMDLAKERAYSEAGGSAGSTEDAQRAGRLVELIARLNEEIQIGYERRRKHAPGQVGPRPERFNVPDPKEAAAFITDTSRLSQIAVVAGVDRAQSLLREGARGAEHIRRQREEPARVLLSLHRSFMATRGDLESIVAPRDEMGRFAEFSARARAYAYARVQEQEAERSGPEELGRLEELRRTADMVEARIVEIWQSGRLARPSIAEDPEWQGSLSEADIFIGNLYAMATIALGSSRGSYNAVAEREVDQLLRYIAEGGARAPFHLSSETPIRGAKATAAVIDLRKEKLALSREMSLRDAKLVDEHGPDGLYHIGEKPTSPAAQRAEMEANPIGATLRAAIHLEAEDAVLLVSEIKTSVSSTALTGSVEAVGGKPVKAVRASLPRKGKGTVVPPSLMDAEAGAYTLWSLDSAIDLMKKRIRSAEDDATLDSAVAQWRSLTSILEAERARFPYQLGTVSAQQCASVMRDPARKVFTLIVVRAVNLFTDLDEKGGIELQPWGDGLPPRAEGRFDRTLVLDIFGMPVPSLCRVRTPDASLPIESAKMSGLIEDALGFNRERFPSLLRSAIGAGFDAVDAASVRKVLRGGG
jgi:hypothetical protein